MKTYLRVSLLAVLAALAGCASLGEKTLCDAPQVQRELGYTSPGCELTS